MDKIFLNAKRREFAQEKRFLNSKETAQFLGVSYSLIKKAVKLQTIPFNRLGRRLVFSVDALEQWARELNANNRQEEL